MTEKFDLYKKPVKQDPRTRDFQLSIIDLSTKKTFAIKVETTNLELQGDIGHLKIKMIAAFDLMLKSFCEKNFPNREGELQ